MSPRIAFLGIGPMGKSISQNLAERGNLEKPLILWNRSPQSAVDHAILLGEKAKAATTLKEVVEQADIIWSCLRDEQAVQDVYEQLLSCSGLEGKLLVDSSTIPGTDANDLGERVRNTGAEFVAMPVFGDPTTAAAAKLVCIPAGPPEAVERIKPYLVDVVARAICDLSGQSVGTASNLKLIGNTLIFNTMEAIAEALVFGEKTNVGHHAVKQLLSTLYPYPQHMLYMSKMVNGGYYMEHALADVGHARHLTSQVMKFARENGASIKAYEQAVEHLAVVEKNAGPHYDITSIYGAIRLESGLPFMNEELVRNNKIAENRITEKPLQNGASEMPTTNGVSETPKQNGVI